MAEERRADEDTPVNGTFLTAYTIALESRGINRSMALELRERLAAFAEEWASPEMDIYDQYAPDHIQP